MMTALSIINPFESWIINDKKIKLSIASPGFKKSSRNRLPVFVLSLVYRMILARFMNPTPTKAIGMASKTETQALEVFSTVFSHNGHIPSEYTCDGKDINPPIEVNKIPEGTRTLALIMEDPDAPRGVFDHWLVWNISPNEAIAEDANPGIPGLNDFGKTGYGGPCPPSGVHRYFFKVYALDTTLELLAGADKKSLLQAMQGHILAEGAVMGLYQRKKKLD